MENKKPYIIQIKRACAVVGFAVLVLLIVSVAYNVLKWKDTNGVYLSSVEMLKNTDDDLIDVVFMGSSHAYHGLIPAYYWEDEGWSCFDMTISGQDKGSTYYHLKNLLKSQSPKVVCVDLYGMTFERHAVEGNVYRNYLSMPTSDLSVKLVKENMEKSEWKDFIVRFPIIHTRYKELEKYDFYSYEPNKYLRGERVGWEVSAVAEPECSDGPLCPSELPEDKVKWLDDMFELSKQEDFELIYVALPFDATAEDQGKIDAVAEYCSEKDIAFYDFNRLRKEAGFDYAGDFIDGGHLNGYGAKKVEKYLRERLAEYNLTDHRGDGRFYQWDLDLEYVNRHRYQNNMATVGDLSGLCSLIKGGEDYLTVISLEGDYEEQGMEFYEPLSILGMTYEEYEKGGKWIFEDDGLIRVYDNEMGKEPFYRELGDMNTLQISYSGDYVHPENVMINDTSFYFTGVYLSIGIYDKNLGEIVTLRGF